MGLRAADGAASGKPRRGSDRAERSRTAIPREVDVAVIGAGLGGLVTAAYLAKAGRRVAVFESHYAAGGCATHFERGPSKARWRFDVGLHYIGDCERGGSIPSILRDLDIDIAFEPLDQDGFDTLVFPDFRFRIPANLAVYRDRLVAMFPHEKRGIDKYVRLVRAVMNVGRTLETYEGKRPPVIELARIALDGARLATKQQATIGDVLNDIVRDPKVKAVMLGQSGDYGLPPSKVSALLHLGLAGHYFRGAYYPRGGGQIIADKLVERIEAQGGAVHLRAPVERILVEGGRAVGLRLGGRGASESGSDVRANLVVSNADIERTLRDLVGFEHLPEKWRTRTERFEMAAALFMTVVGLRGDGREIGLTNSNIWQFDGYDVESFYREAFAPKDGAGPIPVRGCYITSASMKDPSNALHHAPAGHTNLEVMCVVPAAAKSWGGNAVNEGWGYKHDAGYAAQKHALEEELIGRLERLFPGAKERIVLRESATPLTHSRFTGATGGTGYGLAATPAQFMKNRPGYRGPIEGLYLTGASTRAGHGIVGAMMSGRSASKRIEKDRVSR